MTILKKVFLLPLVLLVVFSYTSAYINTSLAQGSDGQVRTASIPSYSTGSLVSDSGTIYFIRGNTKVPFTNYSAFVRLGYSLRNVVQGDLSGYALSSSYLISTPNTAHPWGGWVLYKGTVYYASSQGLIPVPNLQAFTSNGGDFKNVVRANKYDLVILNSNLNLTPLANQDVRVNSQAVASNQPANQSANQNQNNQNTNQSPASAHPAGSLVAVNKTVYYVGPNGLIGIPSIDVFNSWGFNFGNVVPGNSADQALPVVGMVATKQSGQNAPTDAVQNSNNQNATAPTQITTGNLAGSGIQISTNTILQGYVNRPYSGGAYYNNTGSGSYTVAFTDLPAGLSSSSGTLPANTSNWTPLGFSGTPTQAGTYTINLTFTATNGMQYKQPFTLVINPASTDTTPANIYVSDDPANHSGTSSGVASGTTLLTVNVKNSGASAYMTGFEFYFDPSGISPDANPGLINNLRLSDNGTVLPSIIYRNGTFYFFEVKDPLALGAGSTHKMTVLADLSSIANNSSIVTNYAGMIENDTNGSVLNGNYHADPLISSRLTITSTSTTTPTQTSSGVVTINTTTVPAATVGQAYSVTITYTYDPVAYPNPYYVFSTLPSGIAVTAGTASGGQGSITLSGTPTTAGTNPISLSIQYGNPASASSILKTQQYTLVVNSAVAACAPNINTATAQGTTNSVGTLTVTSPNGGECWQQNSNHTITWTSGSNINIVSIYFTQGAAVTIPVASNIANTGSYNWTVNIGNIGTSQQGKIEIIGYQTGVGQVIDSSDLNFTISP